MLLCTLPPPTELLPRGLQDAADPAEAAEQGCMEQGISAPSPPAASCRWIYRDAHSRVSIVALAAGSEQLTASCIFKVSPQGFTPFSTSLTASLPHSASKTD